MLYTGGNKMNSNKSVALLNIPTPKCLAFFPSKNKEHNAWGFTRNCHPELRGCAFALSGSTPLVIIQNKEEMLKQVQHDNRRGFTLIELLVVVLIIGILAAVAVPQYQVAVAKSHLSKYMLLVKSFVAAEEAYYLANGEYTDDMPALDVALPTQGECTYNRTGWGNYYTCMDFSIGIYNDATNVQVNTHNMAYMHFFKDFTSSSTNLEYKKGDIVCFSNESIGRQVCKTLGPGTEYNNETKAWKWEYILSR